jgi:hypothetical protein
MDGANPPSSARLDPPGPSLIGLRAPAWTLPPRSARLTVAWSV